jgi:hypothetical protein
MFEYLVLNVYGESLMASELIRFLLPFQFFVFGFDDYKKKVWAMVVSVIRVHHFTGKVYTEISVTVFVMEQFFTLFVDLVPSYARLGLVQHFGGQASCFIVDPLGLEQKACGV